MARTGNDFQMLLWSFVFLFLVLKVRGLLSLLPTSQQMLPICLSVRGCCVFELLKRHKYFNKKCNGNIVKHLFFQYRMILFFYSNKIPTKNL